MIRGRQIREKDEKNLYKKGFCIRFCLRIVRTLNLRVHIHPYMYLNDSYDIRSEKHKEESI